MENQQQYTNPSDDQINDVLRKYKTVAVVGLSSNKTKAAYGVSEYLQRKGFKIIPVNPSEAEVLGEKAYPDLGSIPEEVDIVDIFRRPEYVPRIVDDAIGIGAKVIWMQLGVVDHAAALKASQRGLTVIMDRCIYKDHRKLLG